MITQAVCVSFLAESFNGVHQPGDEYRMALYTQDAELNGDTMVYTPIGEVVGRGYAAGGEILTGRVVIIDQRTAIIDFNDVTWPVATITAAGALIYNVTRDKRAVAVFSFGMNVTSTNAPFDVALPIPDAPNAVIRAN